MDMQANRIRAFAALCALVFLMPLNAIANTMTAHLNMARVLKMDMPISQIVIGNPALMTVTVLDPYTIAVTGVVSGATNLIVLDADSQTQFSANVIIPAAMASNNEVSVYRRTDEGPTQQTLVCSTSKCGPTIAAGDAQVYATGTTNYRTSLQTEATRNFPTEDQN